MKYVYTFKTSEGVRREAEIDAPTKDEAFSSLRDRGVRPIRLWEKPGQHRVRVVLLVAGGVLLIGALIGVSWSFGRFSSKPAAGSDSGTAIRHQLASQVSVEIFDQPAERYLALYAQPGRKVEPVKMTRELLEDLNRFLLRESTPPRSGDTGDERELRRIVAAMKAEMRTWAENGVPLRDCLSRIIQRQNMEIGYREKLIADLGQLVKTGDDIAAYEHWERANDWLESMGLETIPLPAELDAHDPQP